MKTAVLIWFLSVSCGSFTGDPVTEGGDESPPELVNTRLGKDTLPDCPESNLLTYQNFGRNFLQNYCTSCHSSYLEGEARSGATKGVNMDSQLAAQKARMAILTQVLAPIPTIEMPPNVKVPDQENKFFRVWLNCGAP